MLKTLGWTRSLWPAAGPSFVVRLSVRISPDEPWDFDTKPGTEACSIWSRSCWSAARSADFWSISANLKTRFEESAESIY